MVSHLKESIQIYRIAESKYISDKTGIGSKAYGGRWTPPGYSVLHFSESISLGILEASIPIARKYIKGKISQIEITLPKNMAYEMVELKLLKKGWKSLSDYKCCREFGTKWYAEMKSCAVKVPSAIVDTEFNYLINPNHKDFKSILFGKPKEIDINLKS